MRCLLALTFGVVVLLSASVAAKGVTTKIVIGDLATGQSVTIDSPAVLAHFNVWAGRGTYSGPRNHQTESTDGFIIDWPAGAVDPPAPGLRRYRIEFYVRYLNRPDVRLAYVVEYEHDAASQAGFVYLPGRRHAEYDRNVQAIIRGDGVEGRWFRASREWLHAVGPLLRQ